MVRLAGTLRCIRKSNVMVIGDIVLDTYTIGKAQRISPEAPVAVVKVHHEEYRPGMAGNVALNLVSLGATVTLMGRMGDDAAGAMLRRTLDEEGINASGIVTQKGLPTPVKNRIIAENQQVVRVDREEVAPLTIAQEQELLNRLPQLLENIDIIALSDYAKGLFSPTLLRAIIHLAKDKGIPIIADPKGRDFAKYRGVTVIKPNLSEAIAASGLPSQAPLDDIASAVLKITDAEVLMITRSEAGISLFFRDGHREDFPVKAKEVKDVTGAGDTVLAMLACALASGLTYGEAAQLCNVAAGIAIERFGCARVSLSDLANRLLEWDLNNKIFDEAHLYALQEVLADKKVVVLGLDGLSALSSKLFGAIRKVAMQENSVLIAYLRNGDADEHFLQLLLSLREIDYIMLQCQSLRQFCQVIQPVEVYAVDGDTLKLLDHGLQLLPV